MTIDDTFQRLIGPSEAARQMLERIDPQLALSNRLAATESALQEIQRRQALIDNFSVKSRSAVAALAARYGDAIHRPLIAEIVGG